MVGALIMIVLRTGLRMVNAPAPVQEILIGSIIIIAVAIDQLQHRRRE
jgi:ABC-type xylose transport system permease subunit